MHLEEQLPDSTGSAAALAFLATVVKDHSGVAQSIALYERAVRITPSSASYALNLVHTAELRFDHAEALRPLYAFCAANPDLAVGGLSCATFAAALPPLASLTQLRHTAPAAADAAAPTAAAAAAAGAARALPEIDATAGAGVEGQPGAAAAGTYSAEDLDLLALYFTAVKLLFGLGALQALPPLLRLLEPARNVQDLHLTLVRNENAYYCCIAQLCTSLPLPLPSLPPLYLAGDSHSLSPSWREVSWRGATHLIHPVLVTGLKAWHLRPEADFFPKANFDAAMRAIPDGAPVVFAFGEIDCREGLLIAVERARYKDLDEAIATVVAIYLSRLTALAASRSFRVLVRARAKPSPNP